MKQQENKKFILMTTASVEGLVMRMAVPTITIMLVSAMYNMADTYFVGSLGTSQIAAVGISFSLMAVIQAIGFFFGQGAGNYISRALGEKNMQGAGRMAATGFFTAFGLGCVLSITGSLFLTPLARLLGATDTMLPYARAYLRFILIAAPFMISSFMLNNLLRFQGNASLSMIGMVTGALLNVGLDPLFIYVLHLGVMGASLATMISQIASCSILFVICCAGKDTVRILPLNFSPTPSVYAEIVKGGLPSLLRQALISVAAIFLNHAAGEFGDHTVAAISIVNRVTLISASVVLGVGQGFQPVCGFNYGAKRFDRVKKAFWFSVRSTAILLALVAATAFIFAPQVIAWFRKDDPEVIKIGALALRFQCFALPFGSWIVLNNMFLQTTGNALSASVLAFARQGLFLIPLIFILTPLLGVLGIQLATPIADICTFILAIPLGVKALRKMGRR
ncbi:MAG: MATE family efflux transporter [Treponema sp.]|jgi:putative MATE family efflux protein|nr:MATE family efflux transporter [Treponema sp.]